MADVEEIRSMIDSDELEEESEESIVLGRLNSYENLNEASASANKLSLQGKSVYQSTTAPVRSNLKMLDPSLWVDEKE